MELPDLANVGCTSLEIDFMPEFSVDDAKAVFGVDVSHSPGWAYFGYEEYTVASTKHYCSLYMHHRKRRPPREPVRLHGHLTFRQGSWGMVVGVKKKFEPSISLLAEHPALVERQDLNIRVRYDYKGKDYDSLIKLPMPYPVAAFEQADIVGVRLRVKDKASEERPQFTIIIEKIPSGALYHNIVFRYKVADIANLFHAVLAVSSAISRNFVTTRAGERT